MQVLKGIGSGSGLAMAKALIVRRGDITVPSYEILPNQVDAELARFEKAVEITFKQLNRIRDAIAKTMGEQSASVIDAQIMVLSDPACVDETKTLILSRRVNAEYAFDTVMNSAKDALSASDSPIFVERVQDFEDVRRRVLANLMGVKHSIIQAPPKQSILVIDHLAPSETAQLFGTRFVGLVTEAGGFTSHIAIMSRTMDLPAVLGVSDATDKIRTGMNLIVDSMRGQVIVEPNPATSEKYKRLKKAFVSRRNLVMKDVDKPAQTPDGYRITVAANMELPEEVPLAEHYGAEGIGLFRTELLYIQGRSLPSEDEQFRVYRSIAQRVAPHSAVIRTFDVGGDKFSDIFEHHYEPNPFLGWRATRIGLDHPDILKTQLRAILRASAYGNLKIMFPMITLAEEMTQVIEVLDDVKRELEAESIQFDKNIEVGAMIEVPSAAIMSRTLAKYCDFFSIGTNDLVQYTLAADRGNPRVAKVYQNFHPAVIKLIKETIDAGHYEDIWVGLCGELAADPRATIMLLGMGLDEFSVVPARVPLIKTIIRRIPMSEARKVADGVLHFTTEKEVLNYLYEFNRKFLPKEILEIER